MAKIVLTAAFVAFSVGLADSQDSDRIASLVEELGSDDLIAREQATLALLDLGRPVIATVKPLLDDGDPEVRSRAARVIGGIMDRLRAKALRLEVSVERGNGTAVVTARLANDEDFPVVTVNRGEGPLGPWMRLELWRDGRERTTTSAGKPRWRSNVGSPMSRSCRSRSFGGRG